MIDYSKINGSHCIAIGAERLPYGARRTWMRWSNGETTWAEWGDSPIRAPAGIILIRTDMFDSGHAPIPAHVDMQPPTMPMVANGPLSTP